MSQYSWFSKSWTRKCPPWASLSPSVQWMSMYAKEVIRFGFPHSVFIQRFSLFPLLCSHVAFSFLFSLPRQGSLLIHKVPPPCPWTLRICPGAPVRDSDSGFACRVPWKKWHCFRGFEGQIGVANTWKGLFLSIPGHLWRIGRLERGRKMVSISCLSPRGVGKAE